MRWTVSRSRYVSSIHRFLSHKGHAKLTRPHHKAPEFAKIQQRAKELGTELHYRRIDVRDTELLNSVIEAIADAEGRMDGLLAAAGIQQETPALEYSAQDSNRMFEVNVTGVFMTAQAVAKQMIRFGTGGSIAMIASMSGAVANRVRFHLPLPILLSLPKHPRHPRHPTLPLFPDSRHESAGHPQMTPHLLL